MHRTETLDYAICLKGECDLELDDGRTVPMKAGDICVQRGTMRHGGNGPPLLLLHGNPLTHVSWHAVAPRLAERFHVVAADLRGYGDRSAPPDASPGA
jgi:pimeloyl-ACP methyl ester carboxylesterase